MRIFFSVGEPSGDLHGANLVRALREKYPAMECVGYGGPRMAAEGCQLHFDLTQLAVMLLMRVIWNIRTFLGLIRRANRYFANHQVDAVVLIDFPGMNWWIARQAKKHDIPVFYYGVPQIWAWAGWRIGKMRRLIDFALCKLPFEEEWYRERGCQARYVGHPYFDQLAGQELDTQYMRASEVPGKRLITLLPGSRRQEITGQLPDLVKAAAIIADEVPDVHFAIASLNEEQADLARQVLGTTSLEIQVVAGRTQELIQQASCCLACSGSVSLELMYYQVPSVILYRVGPLLYWFSRMIVNVNYITLVNLIASNRPLKNSSVKSDERDSGKETPPFPEYPCYQDCSYEMSRHLVQWLNDDEVYAGKVSELGALKQRFAHPGATERAADFILEQLLRQVREESSHRAA